MVSVRKFKISCKDKTFYTFARKEQREQNKALNLAMSYIHTSNILKSYDSGAENKITSSIVKLEKKIAKLQEDLEKSKTDSKRQQIEKAIATTKDILEGEKKSLEQGKQYRQGLDKQFNDIYINNNNLYHVIKTQTQIQYTRTIDMVKQKVEKDYKNNFGDIMVGSCSIMNYKNDFPLMIDKKNLNIFEEEGKYKIRIMLGYELDIILGRSKNKDELITTLNRCIDGTYKVCQSTIEINNTEVILNLSIDIPNKNNKYEPVEGRTLGVDLGIKYPVYMCLSDNVYIRKSIGSINDFLRVREQMRERRKKLSEALSMNKGGKGRKKKLQSLDKLSQNEANFVQTYNHVLSKRVVTFALQNKCEYINLEKLTKDGFSDSILGKWSYYQLQKYIEYKAEREGIKIRYVNPAYTSQKCSHCGYIDKENRVSQEKFVCKECGFGKIHGFKDRAGNVYVNADHNAAINIATSK